MAYKCYEDMEALTQDIFRVNLNIACWLMKFSTHTIFTVSNREKDITVKFSITVPFYSINNTFSFVKTSIKGDKTCFFSIGGRTSLIFWSVLWSRISSCSVTESLSVSVKFDLCSNSIF